MTSVALRQAFCGLLAVVVSLPVLFAIHRALGLGAPPISGLLLLGTSVVVAFVAAGVLGAGMGQARSGAGLAAVAGFLVGLVICGGAAPLYASLVVDGLTRDAAGLVLNGRGSLEDVARDAVAKKGGEAFRSAREGRLRQQLAEFQRQAREAVTPQARERAQRQARELSAQLVREGRDKSVALLKLGVARLSAFSLLFWALFGPPFAAAWECRRARRR